MIVWLTKLLTADGMSIENCGWLGLEARAAWAATANFLLAVVCGPRLIAWLRRRFREPNSSPSADVQRLHAHKRDTPTMGGLAIIAAIVGSVLCWGHGLGLMLPLVLWIVLGLGCLGLADDVVKMRGPCAAFRRAANCWDKP